MQPAADAMREALATTTIRAPQVPLVANVTAAPVEDPEAIRDLLVRQVTGSVRWRESVAWMAANGVTEAWEIGAGKALSGMIRRTAPGIGVRNIGTPDEARAAAAALNA
jgi:[acyl-carrier-protein] S-malonyltransferase